MEPVVKYVVYRLPTIAAILFYWITMKVVQQLASNMPVQWSGRCLLDQ